MARGQRAAVADRRLFPLRSPTFALVLLLLLYLVLAGLYSVTTPIFEASDEVWHYPFVKYLADNGGLHRGLPVLTDQGGDAERPWRQEGGQPPLYYALGALLTKHIDTGDLHEVRWLNPHADTGVIKPDGNANMVVHTERERFPYQGAVLAVHLVRWMSVLMGAVTVWAGYLLAREVEPEQPAVALGAAALTTFNAMFLFITSSVNNDALVNMLCALGMWLMVRYVRASPRPWQWALLGTVLALASLSKLSGLAMFPVAAIAVALVAWRRRAHGGIVARELLSGWIGIGLPLLLLDGWWFVRNWRLYRDPTGLSAFVAVVGRRYPQPTLRQLVGEWRGFMMSFWGLFGTMNVPAPTWFYDILTLLAAIGLLGLPLYLWRLCREKASHGDKLWQLGLILLWLAILFLSFLRWTLTTPASQGRLLFPGLTAINLLIALGLTAWPPGRMRPALLAFMGIFMAITAASFPQAVIAPAYRPPPVLASKPADMEPVEARFVTLDGQPQMRLLGYKLSRTELAPGEDLAVSLCWQAEGAMRENYSVFLHLLTADERILSQRDVYPGLGTFPTTLWQPGQIIVDTYILPVPVTAMTPAELSLAVGLYRVETGERLRVLSEAQADGRVSILGDHVRFGRIVLPPRREGEIPNPVHIELEGRIALVGYDLDRTAAAPGESLHLTLYWRALRDIDTNYSVFTQVVGKQDRIWAQMDGWPRGGQAPTATWRRGQLIVDPYVLTIKQEAPPGVYDLQVGMYTAEGKRLTVTGEGGHAKDTRILLGNIRVLPVGS
ncbi:MAG: glycosyltransferase family 39 protein [Chloroflexi bacterium]|nr:glycosyltransferase family 39 protein [Chloroflexota bacterium]